MFEYNAFFVNESESDSLIAVYSDKAIDLLEDILHSWYPNSSYSGEISLAEIKAQVLTLMIDEGNDNYQFVQY